MFNTLSLTLNLSYLRFILLTFHTLTFILNTLNKRSNHKHTWNLEPPFTLSVNIVQDSRSQPNSCNLIDRHLVERSQQCTNADICVRTEGIIRFTKSRKMTSDRFPLDGRSRRNLQLSSVIFLFVYRSNRVWLRPSFATATLIRPTGGSSCKKLRLGSTSVSLWNSGDEKFGKFASCGAENVRVSWCSNTKVRKYRKTVSWMLSRAVWHHLVN